MVFNFSRALSDEEYEYCGSSKKIEFLCNGKIGNGSNGTEVYKGRFEGALPIAVKMIGRDTFKGISKNIVIDPSDINEAKVLREFAHKNVIRYYLLDYDKRSVYLALALCEGNLAEYIELGKPERLPQGDERQLVKKHLLQGILEGLDYLHGSNIIHNDLKPQNILLQLNKNRHDETFLRYNAIISDFGISLQIDPGRQSKSAIDDLIGTEGWRSPEVIRQLEDFHSHYSNADKAYICPEEDLDDLSITKGKISSTKFFDIFAFGCLIQYVMAETDNSKESVRFMHPFGQEIVRNKNIMNGERKTYISKPRSNRILNNILADMLVGICIDKEPLHRPDTKEINKHPFFWKPSVRYQFVETIINDLKAAEKNDACMVALNKMWKDFHPWSFEKELPEVVEYVKFWRASQGEKRKVREKREKEVNIGYSLKSLLLEMRNIKQHFPDIKRMKDENDSYSKLVESLGDGTDKDFHCLFFQKVVQVFPIVYTCSYKRSQEELKSYQAYLSTENPAYVTNCYDVFHETLKNVMGLPDNTTRDHTPKRRSRTRTSSQGKP